MKTTDNIARITVADWNSKYPIGTKVLVMNDSGVTKETVTRSVAQILSSGCPVIWLEGISGCYSLDRVTPIKPEFVIHESTVEGMTCWTLTRLANDFEEISITVSKDGPHQYRATTCVFIHEERRYLMPKTATQFGSSFAVVLRAIRETVLCLAYGDLAMRKQFYEHVLAVGKTGKNGDHSTVSFPLTQANVSPSPSAEGDLSRAGSGERNASQMQAPCGPSDGDGASQRRGDGSVPISADQRPLAVKPVLAVTLTSDL